jgi:SAM-dependent methyltransferase
MLWHGFWEQPPVETVRSLFSLAMLASHDGNSSSSTTSSSSSVTTGELVGDGLAPFNPSGEGVIEAALLLLCLTPADLLFELGCGDARLLVAAAEASGARGVGIEYDSKFAQRAVALVRERGLQDQVTVQHANALDVDLDAATAAFVYLVPKGMAQLRGKLEGLLRRGGRVVTYSESSLWH